MENLTLFQYETIKILKQLEYCCERFEVYNPGDKLEDNFLWISFDDIDLTVLKKSEHIKDIEQYLQKNGVDFHITFDLENEFPDMYIDHEHPNYDFIQLGQVNGESIQDIKTRIEKLIFKINPEEKINKSENILAKKREKKRDKNIFKFDFPKPIQWGELTLKIKDGKEDVEVVYKDKYYGTKSYIDLGFSSNTKNHKPNRLWNLLMMLSIFQNGNITGATSANIGPMFENHTGGFGIKKENFYQTKKLLSDALKTIFGTEEDPFIDRTKIDRKEYYELLFTILPEPALRNEDPWSKRLMTGESPKPFFIEDKEGENPYDDETMFNNEDSDDDKDIDEQY